MQTMHRKYTCTCTNNKLGNFHSWLIFLLITDYENWTYEIFPIVDATCYIFVHVGVISPTRIWWNEIKPMKIFLHENLQIYVICWVLFALLFLFISRSTKELKTIDVIVLIKTIKQLWQDKYKTVQRYETFTDGVYQVCC